MEDLSLELIYRKRFHGAVNIRGIDFQILYTIYEGLLLITEDRKSDSITLEGIEDVDLNPFGAAGTYVQVKTADDPWHWAELSKVIPGFTEVLSKSPNSYFKLVVNFTLRHQISQLANYWQQSIEVKKELLQKFQKLCKKSGVDPSLGQPLLERLSIYSISRDDLLLIIRQLLVDAFNLHPEATHAYILCFAYKFINWAIERKKVTSDDIWQLHVGLSEAFSRKQQFEAYGKYLIGKINWSADKSPSDFFTGKRTRPGHIMLGLDVERPKWLEEISLALVHKQICIIKGASGEGKSTLALRYAYRNWLPEYTYVIHCARTRAEAEEIIEYLGGLSQAGLPITVLMDDVQDEISYYSEILAGCAANNTKVIVTIRNEDYERFTSWGLVDYRIIVPEFDLAEARAIYKNLNLNGSLHKNAPSAESAYEQIGSSATLIEYIFLITQGQMLEDRLRDQLKFMQRSGEDVKLEILRQLIVAHACRVKIDINRFLASPAYAAMDIQGKILELTDEYLRIEENYIEGYHWVRSAHLVKLLHERYVNVSVSGIKVLDYLDEQHISTFIENLLVLENADESVLIDGLVRLAHTKSLTYVLSCIHGLFNGGEKLFFYQNVHLLDEAYKIGFNGGTFLITSSILPTTQLDTIDILVEATNGEENFTRLKEITNLIVSSNRGFQRVSLFLNKVSSSFSQHMIISHPDLLGELLDWLYWCRIKLPVVDQILDDLNLLRPLDLQLEDFCMFSQGLYRYDEIKFNRWFLENRISIIIKLEEGLDCEIKILYKELRMTYHSSYNHYGLSWNDATMYRLQRLRAALPFCTMYNGNNSYLAVAVDNGQNFFNDSFKEIPANNLHFSSDVDKNRIIYTIIEDHYSVKTWYDFLKKYYDARSIILEWVEHLVGLNSQKGRRDIKESIDVNDFKGMPEKTPEPLHNVNMEELFKRCKEFFNDLIGVIQQLSFYLNNSQNDFARRQMLIIYDRLLENLPYMQQFFEELVEVAPDYFEFSTLNKRESKAFREFKLRLERGFRNYR